MKVTENETYFLSQKNIDSKKPDSVDPEHWRGLGFIFTFADKTIHEELKKLSNHISIVHIDCDLRDSAYDALELIKSYANNLRLYINPPPANDVLKC